MLRHHFLPSEDTVTRDKRSHVKLQLASVMCHLFPPKNVAADSVFGAKQKWEGPPQHRPTPTTTETTLHGALYFSTRQLSKWSGPLEVYKRPCLIKRNPPSPTAHTPAVSLWTFVKMLGASGWPGGREAWGSAGRLVEEREKPLRQNVIVWGGADDTLLGHRGRICRALGGGGWAGAG